MASTTSLNYNAKFIIATISIIHQCIVGNSSPIFSQQEQIAGQNGRNIRHLPCISRRSGQEGVCMFAIDCLKSNGTHLGTCIDRFYFGSCCQIEEKFISPEIIDNSIDQNIIPHYNSSGLVKTTLKPILHTVNKTKDEYATTTHKITTVSTWIHKTNHPPSTVQVDGTTVTRPGTVTTTIRATTNPIIENRITSSTAVPYKLSTFQTVENHPNTSTTANTAQPSTISIQPNNASSNKPLTKPSKQPTLKPIQNAIIKPRPRPTSRPQLIKRPTLPPGNITGVSTTTKPTTTRRPIITIITRPIQVKPATTTITPAQSTSTGVTRPYITRPTSRPTTSSTHPDSLTLMPGISTTKPVPPFKNELAPATTKPNSSTTKPDPPTSKPIPSTAKPYSSTKRPDLSTITVSLTTRPVPSTTRPVPSTTRPVPSATRPVPSTARPVPSTARPVPSTTRPVLSTRPAPSTTRPVPSTTRPVSSTTRPVPSTTRPVPSTTRPAPLTTRPVPSTTRPAPLTTRPVPSTTRPVSSTTRPVSSTTRPIQSTTQPVPPITHSVSSTLQPTPSKTRPRPTIPQSNFPSAKPTTATNNPSSSATNSNPTITITTTRPTSQSTRPAIATKTPPAVTTITISIPSTTIESDPTVKPIRTSSTTNNFSERPIHSSTIPIHTSVRPTQSTDHLFTRRPSTTMPTKSTSGYASTAHTTSANTAANTQSKSTTLEPLVTISYVDTTTERITIGTTEGIDLAKRTTTKPELAFSQKPSELLDSKLPSGELSTTSEVSTTHGGNYETNKPLLGQEPVETEGNYATTNKLPGIVTWTNLVEDTTTTMKPIYTTEGGEGWTPITPSDYWVLLPSVSPSGTTQEVITTEDIEESLPPFTTLQPKPPQTESATDGTTTTIFGNQSSTTVTTNITTITTITTDLTDDLISTTMSSSDPSFNMSDFKDVCGRRMYPEARIVGGAKATFGKWPWQISLRQWRTSTYLHKCGAALLNENWAITAAHCVDNVPPSDLLLRLGEHDLAIEEEPYGYQERRVQIVASHPQFDPRTFEYDLALLRFYEPVTFQANILPVCVPQNDEGFVGKTAYVTGWGRLYEDGPLPSILQEVSVPVINNSVCETMYRSAGYIEHIPNIFICAGWRKGGFDSCEGDSGGPMVIQRPDRRFLLAGVISWGIGCAEPNQPGVYTRISAFRDWINQILQF